MSEFWRGRRVVVTGATGFVGSWLAEALAERGADVFAVRRSWRSPIDGPGPAVTWLGADVTDPTAVRAALGAARPEVIFHLAALSFVPDSWRQPDATLTVNLGGTMNVLEACRAFQGCRVLVASSSEAYGLVEAGELPIAESQPFRPLSPYGVSKAAADLLAWQYHRSWGVDVVRVRPFNTTGPRRGAVFMTSALARQVAECQKGLRERIEAGNLLAVRDLTDVRDVAQAYLLLAELGQAGEPYNICSGRGRTVLEVVAALRDAAGLGPVAIVSDPTLNRPSDVPWLIGDATKLRRETGWTPEIPFEQTMADLLTWHGERLG